MHRRAVVGAFVLDIFIVAGLHHIFITRLRAASWCAICPQDKGMDKDQGSNGGYSNRCQTRYRGPVFFHLCRIR